MREVKLPSGATLKVTVSPFAVSRALYQAFLRELRSVPVFGGAKANVYKDIFCASFASPEIEAWLWKCFERCTVSGAAGDLKIDQDTFEPEDRRADYTQVCIEVATDNVFPFGKSLYAEFQRVLAMIEGTQV